MSKKGKVRPPLPVIGAPVVDSHAHLEAEPYGGEEVVEEIIAQAFGAGLVGIVAIGSGYGPGSGRRAVDLARRHPGRIRATVGIHPHQARLWDGAVADLVRQMAREPEVVAIGEAGLDFHYDFSPRDDQRRALGAQVLLAREAGLPLVIHDRESAGETLRIREGEGAFSGNGVLVHCFSGSAEEMERWVALGAYISLPGVVTWERTVSSHEVARAVPLDRLLVETDAPFLAPEPWRGHRNVPAYTLYTVAAIARLRGVDPEVVARATTANAARFFRWSIGTP